MKRALRSNAALIQGCIGGSASAQNELYVSRAPEMKRLAYRITRNSMDAEDVVQESFVRIFKSIHQLKEPDQLNAWIYRLVYNTSLNLLATNRMSRLSQEIEDYLPYESGTSSFESRFIATDELKHALRVLQIKAPTQYMHFRLYSIEGMNHNEIAEGLGISVGTCKSNYSRAVAKLRNIISGSRSNDKRLKPSA